MQSAITQVGGTTLEYFDLTLSLSLNSWLTKSRVLFIILEGNLRSGLTSVGKVHTVSRLDHPVTSDSAFLDMHPYL